MDLSEKGYGAAGQPRVPGIRHLAMFNRDPNRKWDFYQQVFGMRDTTRTDEEMGRQFTMTTGKDPAGCTVALSKAKTKYGSARTPGVDRERMASRAPRAA